PLLRAGLLCEQSSGVPVALGTLCTGKLRVDPALDDRVDEGQRPSALENPCRYQELGCVSRLGLVELRQPRRPKKVALLEDRQRLRQPPGILRQAPEPEADGGTDRLRGDLLEVARGLRSRSDPSLAQCVQELAQQEW